MGLLDYKTLTQKDVDEINRKNNRTWRRRLNKDLKRKLRKERKYPRVPKQYATYIKSKHWRKRRNQYWQNHPRKCCICSSSDHITLHHAVYGRYGREKDKNLFPFCWGHHQEFHEWCSKIKGNMLKETEDFIEMKEREIAESDLDFIKHL